MFEKELPAYARFGVDILNRVFNITNSTIIQKLHLQRFDFHLE